MKPLARTFFDTEVIEVELISKPTSTGLVRVLWGEKTLVRHKNRITPINDAAKELLCQDATSTETAGTAEGNEK